MDSKRKNIIFGVLHETIWGISFALVDPITILQLALKDLGGQAEMAGLLAGLLFALVNAPQMLSAFLFHPRWSDPRLCALLHGPAIAFTSLMAALFFFFPGMDIALKLKLYLALAAGFFVSIGFVVPHWISMISRCVPDGVRGRYFAWCFSLASLGGIVSGALGAHWISVGGQNWGYALCFAVAAALQVCSVSVFFMLTPLEARPQAPGRLRVFLREQWKTVTTHKGFAAFAIVCVLMQFCGAPYAQFTDYLKERGVETSWWGLFNGAKNLGGVLGSFVIGYLADKHGPKGGLYLAFAAMAFALVLMPMNLGHSASAAAFFGGGFYSSAFPVLNLYLFMLLAAPGQTSNFSGTFATVTAPVIFIAPMLVGMLVAKIGAAPAFAASALLCLITGVYVWRSRNFGIREAAV